MKMFSSWTESKHPKIYPIGSPQINALKFLLLSLQSFVAERCMWICKSIIKKRRKEKIFKKWTSVQKNKTMGTLMPA
jgi:hypothetical protein